MNSKRTMIRSPLQAMWLLMSLLFAATAVHAQAIRITAANSSNSLLYDVTFDGENGFITPLNTDQSTHVAFRSVAFRTNLTTFDLDVIVADGSRGELVLYPAGSTVSQLIWDATKGVQKPAEGAGPVYPDGISLDADGNLFVVTSKPGRSSGIEIWVFRHNPAGPLLGGFDRPRLLDKSFGGRAIESLVETGSITVANPFGSPGDLLALAGSPAMLFRYPAARVQSVLQDGGPASPDVVIATSQFPAKTTVGGFDVWPADGTLLVTTNDGRVLRYAAAAGRLPDFTSGLGNGKYKIKTGLEFGVPIAVVADNNGGDLLKFGAPPASGRNQPLAVVTRGVESPQGLAITNTGVIRAANCLTSGGCDALGGVLNHQIQGPLTFSGNLLESVCVLPTDPRITEFGTCTGHTLPVAKYCGGFPDVEIPDHLCGASGATGKGLALINTSSGATPTPTQLVFNEADADNILPASTNLPCPKQTLGWWPKSNEGSILEGNRMLEVTSGCGSSRGLTRTLSIWGVGLALNEAALKGETSYERIGNFAYAKYISLLESIVAAPIEATFKTTLKACISDSARHFEAGRYANAAGALLPCDTLIAQNPNAFSATAENPNAFGELRGRIANLYLTIDSRMLGNPSLASWPP